MARSAPPLADAAEGVQALPARASDDGQTDVIARGQAHDRASDGRFGLGVVSGRPSSARALADSAFSSFRRSVSSLPGTWTGQRPPTRDEHGDRAAMHERGRGLAERDAGHAAAGASLSSTAQRIRANGRWSEPAADA